MINRKIRLGKFEISNTHPIFLIGGPCVIESESLCLSVAKRLKSIAAAKRIPYVFKASYDKANRSSLRSFRGPGLEKGLEVLRKVKEKTGVPICTDVHNEEEAFAAADVADIIQIPAFLCRQTNLLLAAGQTGKIVNIKKGQFMAPWDMGNAVKKVESTGNRNILLTERGTSFGYNNLTVDMRGLDTMKKFGYPVVYDATHSVQLPGGLGHATGGQREFVWPLARAAAAIGIAGFFMEIHPNPDKAKSDGPNSARLSDVPKNLSLITKIDRIVKQRGK